MRLSPETIAAVLRRDFDEYVTDGKPEACQAVEVLAYAFADLMAPDATFDRENFLTAAIGGVEGDPSNGLPTLESNGDGTFGSVPDYIPPQGV